ncbi:MAG: NAD(P)/FAD-dependent oxidoreductase [bacterium]|nr:NAD(P)/FAD-dependent oxidoreductase [bacterium]
MTFDAIVIGGGAAGLFCAAEAGRRGKRVLVIERNAQVGRKIIVSGGGRCNFTNRSVNAENFVSENPHFAKSALARYTSQDFVELVRKHQIAYYEKKLGQLFCRESSKQIVEMLIAECRDAKVRIVTGCSVERVERGTSFSVKTDQGTIESERLVVATGGLSFAKIGATDFGYQIARQFGLKIIETRPSLVPLVLSGESFRDLAGVSVDAIVSTDGKDVRENILFTHRGMSGPAILQISNYWDKSRPVLIDLLGGVEASGLLSENRNTSKRLDNFLAGYIPAKVADRLFGKSAQRLSDMSDAGIAAAARRLNHWELRFKDTEGYDKAEVTLGGVSTDELSSKTFESKKVPGLFFIGEVLDVTGWLGGYNFQWAWSSGYAAAQDI